MQFTKFFFPLFRKEIAFNYCKVLRPTLLNYHTLHEKAANVLPNNVDIKSDEFKVK